MLVLIGEKAKSALLIAKIKFHKYPASKVCLVPGLAFWFEKAAYIIDMLVVCTDNTIYKPNINNVFYQHFCNVFDFYRQATASWSGTFAELRKPPQNIDMLVFTETCTDK